MGCLKVAAAEPQKLYRISFLISRGYEGLFLQYRFVGDPPFGMTAHSDSVWFASKWMLRLRFDAADIDLPKDLLTPSPTTVFRLTASQMSWLGFKHIPLTFESSRQSLQESFTYSA